MIESNNFKKLLSNQNSNKKQVTQFAEEDPNVTNIYPLGSNNKPITLQSLDMKKTALMKEEILYLRQQLK